MDGGLRFLHVIVLSPEAISELHKSNREVPVDSYEYMRLQTIYRNAKMVDFNALKRKISRFKSQHMLDLKEKVGDGSPGKKPALILPGVGTPQHKGGLA